MKGHGSGIVEAPTKASDPFSGRSLLLPRVTVLRGHKVSHVASDWAEFEASFGPLSPTVRWRRLHQLAYRKLRRYYAASAERFVDLAEALKTFPGAVNVKAALSALRRFTKLTSALNRLELGFLAEIAARGQHAVYGHKQRTRNITPKSVAGSLRLVDSLGFAGPDILKVRRGRGRPADILRDELLDDLTELWLKFTDRPADHSKNGGEFKHFVTCLLECSIIALEAELRASETYFFREAAYSGPVTYAPDMEKAARHVKAGLSKAITRSKRRLRCQNIPDWEGNFRSSP